MGDTLPRRHFSRTKIENNTHTHTIEDVWQIQSLRSAVGARRDISVTGRLRVAFSGIHDLTNGTSIRTITQSAFVKVRFCTGFYAVGGPHLTPIGRPESI